MKAGWKQNRWLAVASLFALALSTGLLVTACGKRPTIVEQDKPQFPAAIAVYENGCITCHGDNLQGGIGPNLQHIGSKMSLAAIKHRIEVGAGPMPAYTAPGDEILTTQQVNAVATWLESKK